MLRVRIVGGQLTTQYQPLQFVEQRDGKRIAHARILGSDFDRPVDLGSEIIVDVEDDRRG